MRLTRRRFLKSLTLTGAMGFSMATPPDSPYGPFVNRTDLWGKGTDVLSGFRNMYQFHVLHDASDPIYPFKAWFFGWAVEDCNRHLPGFKGCDAIFAARSRSPEGPWQVFCGEGKWDLTQTANLWRPIFAPQDKPFDQWHNGDPSVIKVGNRFYMAYSSTGHNRDGKPYGEPGDKDGSLSCIMGAVSQDGLHWRRSEKPILINPSDLGAPPVPEGDAHLWGSFHRPSLLYEEGRFRLWFDYWSDKGVAMGYAENQGDFLNPDHWKIIRSGTNPCLFEFPNPDVVKVGDLYFAFADPSGYDSHPWKGRKIVEAVSLNGLDWLVLGFLDPDPDTPATHVPEAFVWSDGQDFTIYLFYSCQRGGEPYDYRYHTIRVKKRRMTEKERRFWREVLQSVRLNPYGRS
ncbi:MAG: hypothetical protein NZ959_11225 [Armatimonadetes bacterium]|nr:hypothetical protein [Armatimonadota bacterium]MDW8122518.1 hypothetical protein [Armatimonadota bacterium]